MSTVYIIIEEVLYSHTSVLHVVLDDKDLAIKLLKEADQSKSQDYDCDVSLEIWENNKCISCKVYKEEDYISIKENICVSEENPFPHFVKKY